MHCHTRSLAWLTILFAVLLTTTAAIKTASKPRAIDTRELVAIRTTIRVALVGFSRDGELGLDIQANELADVLREMFGKHRPSCQETGKPLNVYYDLSYKVVNVESRFLTEYMDVAAGAMVAGEPCLPSEFESETPVFKVPGETLDPVLKKIVASIGGGPGEETIIIVNPSRSKMLPSSATPASTYYYTYSDVGQTQSWTGPESYAVVDLGAGPCQYGSLEDTFGSVAAETFPSPRAILGASERPSKAQLSLFKGGLVASIAGVVRSVFVPDIRWVDAPHAQKTLVPILVFTNHNEFDPFDETRKNAISVEKIKMELQQIALPDQQFIVVTGVYSIHEHPDVGLAWAKAIRHDTHHNWDEYGHYFQNNRPYIDSDVLAEELRDSGDVIVESVLPGSMLSTMFFGDDGTTERGPSKGLSIKPVFVFSLSGLDHALSFNGDGLVDIEKDMAIVLQKVSPSHRLVLPYFTGPFEVEIDPEPVTVHIMAGILGTIGGVVAPTLRFSPHHGRLVTDYSWAIGHHPFGPFGKATSLSALSVEAIQRNVVLARLSAAMDLVRETVVIVENFAQAYLYDPSERTDPYTAPELAGTVSRVELWVDRLAKYASSRLIVGRPLAKATVVRLREDLLRLEGNFEKAAALLVQHKWQEVELLSRSLVESATNFKTYAHDDLHRARVDALCCKFVHVPEHHSPSVPASYSLVIVVIIAVTLGVLVLLFPKQEKKSIYTR